MDTYWAWEYGTGDKKNAIELVRAADAQRALDDLKAQLAACQVENSRLIGMAAQQALADTDLQTNDQQKGAG